jgi:MFS family permease
MCGDRLIAGITSPFTSVDESSACATFDRGLTRVLAIVLIVMAIKCLLAWLFPFTGDETYLALQAKQLRLGYYDHPPAVLWILHGLLSLGRSPLLLRLPTVAFTGAIGLILYLLLRSYDRRKAYLASVLFLVSPLNMAFFVISTETPLLFFSFLSAASLFLGEKNGHYRYYALSGLCLGLAFLSKYFAVLLGLSYLAYFVLAPGKPRRWKGLALLVVGAAPFVTLNAQWNYMTGWPNIMHNWVNRFRPETNVALNILLLVFVLIYFLTPPVILFLFKNRQAVGHQFGRREFRLISLALLLPLLVFLAASLRKNVGAHWLLSFLPLAYVLVALPFSAAQLHKCIRFALVVSVLQIGFLVAGSLAARYAPVHRLKDVLSSRDMAALVLHVRPRHVLDEIAKNGTGYVLATKSYQLSALLERYTGRRVIVLGRGSRHGREDDMLTDFRTLDGCDFLILYKATPDEDEYRPYFRRTERRPVETAGASFTLVAGYGFRYQVYREKVLKRILERYYQIPDWLPGSRDFFSERYGL